jgi:hypothetical protein
LLQWKKLDIATSSILAPPHKKKGLGQTTNKSNLRQKNRRKNKTTEKDVIAILEFFLESPPIESVPRQRMWWIVTQISAYLTQTLYSKDGDTVPCAVKKKLKCAVALFPRGKHDPHHDEDMRTMKKYQHMGVAIRKETEHAGFKSGFVEEIVTSRAHGRHGMSDDDDEDKSEHDEDESIPKKYLVVYFSHQEEEVVTEDEIIQNKLPSISFDMVG